MEITQQVRDYAAKLNRPIEEAQEEGMAEMSEKFKEMGGEVYVEAKDWARRMGWVARIPSFALSPIDRFQPAWADFYLSQITVNL